MMNMRKNYQRKFNKIMRAMNKNIANDELWRGRFIFRQTGADFYRFEDGSGGILYVEVRGYDKKTGFYKDTRIEYAPYFSFNEYHLWSFANTFIGEDSGVWKEEPRINRQNAKDYTSVIPNEKVWHQEKNWYLDYEHWKE